MLPLTLALITFDIGDNGIVPVARNHLEMLAGGLSVTLEGKLAQDARILSTMAPSSFAGVSLTLMPWLLCAGTLSLHHPFDPEVLAQQQRDETCRDADSCPARSRCGSPKAARWRATACGTIVGVWRSPERLTTSPAWREPEAVLVDVPIFGEAGFVRRAAVPDGRAAPHSVRTGRGAARQQERAVVAELSRTAAGTVALRGPMVPRHAFPPGIERSGLPHFKIDRFGLVDTGYTCRIDAATKAMVVTGPPSGIVSVGGYRFPLQELQEAVGPHRQRRDARGPARSAHRSAADRQCRQSAKWSKPR